MNIKDRVRAEYDQLSHQYESRWRSYVTRSIAETLRRAAIREDDRVLDVGCGTGKLLEHVQRGIGVDLSLGMLAAARVRVAAADAESLPFRDASFDVVVSSSSLHFWPHPDLALREFRRVLHRGGRVVITDWCDDFLACRLCDAFLRWRNSTYPKSLGATDCERLLGEAGFTGVAVDRYRISWLWGLMTAVAHA